MSDFIDPIFANEWLSTGQLVVLLTFRASTRCNRIDVSNVSTVDKKTELNS